MAKTGSYQTKARQMILKYLQDNKDTSVSVVSIIDYLRANDTSTNISTVYRYLDKLVDEQVVFKYMNDNGEKAVYQYIEQNRNCHEHLHLKCISCGIVEHLDCDFMSHLNDHIMKDHGFQVECSKSILYGYCKNCI